MKKCLYFRIFHNYNSLGRDLAHVFYSPIICNMTLRSLCLVSISKRTICCQVPNSKLPSLNGIVKLGPIRDARTWECPFPSCHVLLCLYSISFGTILDNILGKSSSSPGSYSIVVTAAVEPETKTMTIPSSSLLSSIAFEVYLVRSTMSFSPFDLVWIVLVIILIWNNQINPILTTLCNIGSCISFVILIHFVFW